MARSYPVRVFGFSSRTNSCSQPWAFGHNSERPSTIKDNENINRNYTAVADLLGINTTMLGQFGLRCRLLGHCTGQCRIRSAVPTDDLYIDRPAVTAGLKTHT